MRAEPRANAQRVLSGLARMPSEDLRCLTRNPPERVVCFAMLSC